MFQTTILQGQYLWRCVLSMLLYLALTAQVPCVDAIVSASQLEIGLYGLPAGTALYSIL